MTKGNRGEILCRAGVLAGVLAVILSATAGAATRIVHVGMGGTQFVDEVSGTSTSTIAVGDSVQWVWSAGTHSTTSGPCTTICTCPRGGLVIV